MDGRRQLQNGFLAEPQFRQSHPGDEEQQRNSQPVRWSSRCATQAQPVTARSASDEMRTVLHEYFKCEGKVAFAAEMPSATRLPNVDVRDESAGYVKFIDCADFAA